MAWEAFDVETDGELREYALQPWRVKDRQAWLTSWSVSSNEGNRVTFAPEHPRDTANLLRPLVERWLDEKTTVCLWNGVFDVSWLYAYGFADWLTQVKWLDGMLLWRHIENQPQYGVAADKRTSFGLKRAVEHYLPQYAGYEEGVDFSGSDPLMLLHYNACDTWFTRALTRHFYLQLEKEPRRLKAALIEAHSIPLIARTVYEGMEIDHDGLDSLDEYLQQTAADRLAQLKPHGATDKVLASPKQLSELLFEDWGLTPLKHGKTGPSTDKETLVELAQKDDRMLLIHQYREAKGNHKKFCVNVRAAAEYNNDGRAHPEAKVFGTYTGRVTYASAQGRNKDRRQTGWALHQMKRDPEYRRLIKAPNGYQIVELDAAGQEFRWMAELSGDPTMRALCQPGEDPHSYMGAQVGNLEYREVQEGAGKDKHLKAIRQVGKVANLCVAADTLVLTDRGYTPIVDVTLADLVWDGVEFVRHEGVVCSGVRPVLQYRGIIATPDHQVLVNGQWVSLDEAARHGWQIESALGTGWACKARAVVRIMGGVVRRAVSEARSTLRSGSVLMLDRAGGEPAFSGDRQVQSVQKLRCKGQAHPHRTSDREGCTTEAPAEANERLVPAVQQPQLSILSQLWGAWHRVPFRVGRCLRDLCVGELTPRHLSWRGHRQDRQQRALRTRESASGFSGAEPAQHKAHYACAVAGQANTFAGLGGEPLRSDHSGALCRAGNDRRSDFAEGSSGRAGEAQRLDADSRTVEPVYDIVNCGPRTRFAANGVIVHNSLQFRTSAPRLLSAARVNHGMMDMTLPKATHIRNTYLRAYRGVPEYWQRQIAFLTANNYVKTLAGRKVVVPPRLQSMFEWSTQSTSINFPVQGTGGDQKYLAMSVIRPLLLQLDAIFLFDLHDGLYFLVPDAAVDEFITKAKYLFDNLPYEKAWGIIPSIPLPWDVKVGPTWGTMEELDL